MLKRRIAMVALVIAGLFLFGLIMGVFMPRLFGPPSGRVAYNTAVVIQQVQTLSELVTVKYVMEKVVVVEDVRWLAGLGENRVLLVAHGIVKAGVDLRKLEPQHVNITGRKISLKLPRAQITDAYLDDNQTRVVERSTGLLRTFDKDLEQTARQQAVDDIRRGARTAGILREAEDRAKSQLMLLFRQAGFEEVKFQ